MTFLTITESKNEKRLITTQPLKKRELIFTLKGELRAIPSKYSLQINENTHLDVPSGELGNLEYAWAFLNHSCAPNCYMKNQELYASEDIDANTELTFNYNTTEYDMATPFICKCGSENCLGEIRGYKHLQEKK